MTTLGSATAPVVDRDELVQVVALAASQTPEHLRTAADRLKVLLDTHAGTSNALHQIAADLSQPLHVRQQSIIQFKNTALSCWRSRKLSSDDDREQIRLRCFAFLSEEDDTIARCNGLIVSKIARIDYPLNWPSLLTQLMLVIESGLQSLTTSPNATVHSSLVLRRALQTLNAVVKEFSRAETSTAIETMSQIVDQLRNVVLAYYSRLSPMILNMAGLLDRERTLASVVAAHLAYKCLVKMALWSWTRIVQDGKGEFRELGVWFLEVFQSSTAQLKALSELRISLVLAVRRATPTSDPITALCIDRLTRHVGIFGKFFKRLQQIDAKKFVELPTCNDVVMYYWLKVVDAVDCRSEDMIQDSFAAVYPVRFLVQAMVLFKENLSKWTPFRKGGPITETTLPQQFVEESVQMLIKRFIPLNPSDLEGWMTDPEEWVNGEDKENEHWEYELRPCGERVLMTLAAQYPDYVVPLMESNFKAMLVEQPTTDLSSILQKEALYCAMGRCAAILRDVIPFNEWMRHKLVVEARETNPNFPIIKRRIAWLIGKWISDGRAPHALDPVVWEILVQLLRDRSPGSDAVVRLTAANALRECVDTVDFDAAAFAPFLHATVTELMRLMGEADTMETKQRLAKNLNVVVERADQHVVPHVPMIAEAIPVLWNAAGEEWLFKAQLLEVVKSLIISSKEYSASLVPLVVPLMQESLSSTAAVNLDEDGIDLWLAALRNSTTLEDAPSYDLLRLFPHAMALLASNLDLLGKITYVIESYLFADASLVLQNFSSDLMNAVMSVMHGQALQTNKRGVLNCVDFMVRLAPWTLWAEPVHRSGFFDHMIKILDDRQSSFAMLIECILVLARIALTDRETFVRLVSAAAQMENVREEDVWNVILDQFCKQFDHLSEPWHRKLVALGIASVVSTGHPEVLEFCTRTPDEVFKIWMDVCSDEASESRYDDDGDDEYGGFNWDVESVPASYFAESEGTLEYDRRSSLYEKDPARTLRLMTSVARALQQAGGGEHSQSSSLSFQFEQYLEDADQTVLEWFRTELATP